MNSSTSIRGIIVIACALVMALWLGVSIVTSQTETVVYIAASSLIITCIFLGRKIWLLYVFFAALNIPVIRGIDTTELGQMLFIGFTMVIFLMRRQPLNIKFGEKELWMLLLASCIAQAYFRNPVGLNIFGAGAIGARPYFEVTVAFVAALVLASVVVTPLQIRWALRLSIIGSILGVFMTAIRLRGVDVQSGYAANTKLDDGQNSNRIGGLGQLGNNLARVVVSYVSPLKAMLHPLWAVLILFTIAAAAGSGYRNSVASIGLLYLIGIAYRGGFIATVVSIIGCAMVLAMLAVINVASPLPPNIQRALSPFPGTWDKRHVEAAEESTEWRVTMWKEALLTDYWIRDKVFGDGLGLTRKEYELITSVEDGSGGMPSMGSGMTAQQEAMMIVGGYHSGPVQTIRTIGYVGLGVLVFAMIRMAVFAHRQIIRCRGTEWLPVAMFIGIPSISLPFIFVFVFGDFGRDVSALFFSYAMISILERNLPLPAYVKPRRTPYVLNRAALLREPLQAPVPR